MKNLTCCFTGHRPQSLPFRLNEKDERCVALSAKLKSEIERFYEDKNITHFISGMALGIDQICAELVLELKEQHLNITLECAIPCEEQAVNWTEPQRDRYFGIIECCDKETMLQHHYDEDCMMKRNCYMVDASQVILAVWNGKPSGTANTVKYAQEQGKTVIVIDPQTLETKII